MIGIANSFGPILHDGDNAYCLKRSDWDSMPKHERDLLLKQTAEIIGAIIAKTNQSVIDGTIWND